MIITTAVDDKLIFFLFIIFIFLDKVTKAQHLFELSA